MAKVRFSRLARNDLLDLWCWIAVHDRAAADKVIADFDRRCSVLRYFPMIGPARPDIEPSIRMMVWGNFVILYRLGPKGVLVKRVVRGRRKMVPGILGD